MRFKNYKAYDFIRDEFFVSWVLHPTPEADAFWADWLAHNPNKLGEVQQAQALCRAMTYKRDTLESAESRELLERIVESASSQTIPASRKRKQVASVAWRPYSAAAALLIGLLLLSLYRLNIWQVADSSSDVMNEAAPVWIEKENPAGLKSILRLPDGSVITLNAGSKLRMQERFPEDRREIWLEGEAFFDVAKDSLRPFIVHTAEMAAYVLGTSFNVRAQPNSGKTLVALVSGSLRVEPAKPDNKETQEISLSPGEAVSVAMLNQPLRKYYFDVEMTTAWMHNTIVFENADFSEIVDYLSNWYGVEFTIQKYPKRQAQYSGTFKSMSLQEVLMGIGYASGFEYRIEDKKVIIY